MRQQAVNELSLHTPTIGLLGAYMAPQQVGLWVPQALGVEPKQLVRLNLSVGWPLRWRLRLIAEVAEVAGDGANGEAWARVVLGPSGWERVRAQLSSNAWRRAEDLSADPDGYRRPVYAPVLWRADGDLEPQPGYLLDASAGGVFLARDPQGALGEDVFPAVGGLIAWRFAQGSHWFDSEVRWQGQKAHPNGQSAHGVGCALRLRDTAAWLTTLGQLPSEDWTSR